MKSIMKWAYGNSINKLNNHDFLINKPEEGSKIWMFSALILGFELIWIFWSYVLYIQTSKRIIQFAGYSNFFLTFWRSGTLIILTNALWKDATLHWTWPCPPNILSHPWLGPLDTDMPSHLVKIQWKFHREQFCNLLERKSQCLLYPTIFQVSISSAGVALLEGTC